MRIVVDTRPESIDQCPFVKNNDTSARGVKDPDGNIKYLSKKCGLSTNYFCPCGIEAYGRCNSSDMVTVKELSLEGLTV